MQSYIFSRRNWHRIFICRPVLFPTYSDRFINWHPTKSKGKLGWTPEHDLAYLFKDMMESDINLMKKDSVLLKAGHEILK